MTTLYKHIHAIFIIEFQHKQYMLYNFSKEHILKFALENNTHTDEYNIDEVITEFIRMISESTALVDSENGIGHSNFILLDKSFKRIKDEIYFSIYLKLDTDTFTMDNVLAHIEFMCNDGAIYFIFKESPDPATIQNSSMLQRAKYELKFRGDIEAQMIHLF